ncbi:hypothetical protein [Microbacterium lacus]|uniref:hypothetical protein n=1 Tax=Microbacterium lacus TaxID=415217 RepID=UPI000C2C36F5|nr:hypothetical protein [Microbacterium lacus]
MATYLIGGRLVAGGGRAAGEITVRALVPRTVSVEVVLNDAGSIEANVTTPQIDPITKTAVDLTTELVSGRDFLGLVVNDTIVECGPIWGDPNTPPFLSTLHADGLLSYFDHRTVLPVLTGGQLPRDVTSKWVGLSLRTILKRLVQQAISWPGAGLPIDFEPDFSGSHEREYPGTDLTFVGDAMRNIAAVDGGPDFTLRPKWGTDRRHVRWDLLTGNPELTQGGHDHLWDVSAPTPHAKLRYIDRDARELASHSYVQGVTLRNLQRDPSFEDDPSPWRAASNASEPVFLSGGTHGARYAQWSAAGAGSSYLDGGGGTTVEAGDKLTVSADIGAGATRNARLMLRFTDSAGTILADVYSGAASAPAVGWARHVLFATAPAGSTSARLYIEGQATGAAQTFRADSVMFTTGSEQVPFAVEEIQLEARASSTALLSAGFPMLEAVESRNSVLRASTLQAYADEGVARGSGHVETFEIVARRDRVPKLGTYWPGDYALVRTAKTARLPAGRYRVRIVRVAFSKTGMVTLECAPERIASGYPVPSSNRTWLRDKLRALAGRIAESNRGA